MKLVGVFAILLTFHHTVNSHRYKNIIVQEPLHSFLASLANTTVKDTATDIQRIIGNIESELVMLPQLAATDLSSFFNNLIISTDNAFESIGYRILHIINVEAPAIAATSDELLGHLNSLKWSIHELNDSIALNPHLPLTDSVSMAIDGAALSTAFVLEGFLSAAMKLVDAAATSADFGNLVERVLVDTFGVLQLVSDVADGCDVAVNILFGHHSSVLSAVKLIIGSVFSSLVNDASHLKFSEVRSSRSSYLHQFKKTANNSIAVYNSKYGDLFRASDDIFETVKGAVKTFDKELQILANRFSGLTLRNAAISYKDIMSLVDGTFGVLDFILFSVTIRAPHTLLSDATDIISKLRIVETSFKLLLKSLTPPLKQAVIQQCTKIAVPLSYEIEIFATACYKFLINAAPLLSEFVSELTSTVMLALNMFTQFYYKAIQGANNLVKIITGQTVPFFNSLNMIEGISSLFTAVSSIITLTPTLYTATTDTIPSEFANMSSTSDNAFKLIESAYSTQVEVISSDGISTVSNALDTIGVDVNALLSTIISFSKSPTDESSAVSIENDAQKLSSDIQELTEALSILTQNTINNVQNAIQTALIGFLREVLSSVLQIVYYIVFNITRYLDTIVPGSTTVSVLTSINEGFLSALTNSTVQLKDFNQFLNNDIKSFKHMSGFVTASLNGTTNTLSKSSVFHKIRSFISGIHSGLNNKNTRDYSRDLNTISMSSNSTFDSIINGVQQIFNIFPKKWRHYGDGIKLALLKSQVQTNALVQDMVGLTSKSSNIPISDVIASTIRAASAVLDLGNVVLEMVNAASNKLTYHNVLLLVALQRVLAAISQTTAIAVSHVSSLFNTATTKNNPMDNLAAILNNVKTGSNGLTRKLTFSSVSNIRTWYGQIKASLNSYISQLSNAIAAVTSA